MTDQSDDLNTLPGRGRGFTGLILTAIATAEKLTPRFARVRVRTAPSKARVNWALLAARKRRC